MNYCQLMFVVKSMKTRATVIRSLLMAIFIMIGSAAHGATATADAILQAMRSKLASSAAVDLVFTINGGDGPMQGSATLAGASFVFNTPALNVWYDGRTQWTYLSSTREVSITEPDSDELISSNPFAIINSYAGHYKVRRLKDASGHQRVELIPLDKMSPFSSINLVVDPSTHWPTAIVLNFSDNRKIEVVIDKINGRGSVPESTFTYNAARYPASEIIDLR